MKLHFKTIAALLLGAIIGASQAAQAAVIFDEDFTTETNATWKERTGTFPLHHPQNAVAGVGDFIFRVPGTGSFKFQIAENEGGLGRGLHSAPNDGSSSTTHVGVPYDMDLTGVNDVLRLTVVVKSAHTSWNNLIIGFHEGTGTQNIAVNSITHRLMLSGGSVQNWWDKSPAATPGVALPASALAAQASFHKFVLEYDPTKAGIANMQPLSFWVNDTEVAVPLGAAGTIHDKMTRITGVGFGSLLSNGANSRSFVLQSMKFEVVPEPSAIALLGLGAVGLVGWVARRRLAK
ncbi:MAG: PEP-CTERM sorting domain-containing protein [Planctomycetota bacterium]|nr:PEP-CTERM sorting domain-containing protein [Planctomycetota bacterium]